MGVDNHEATLCACGCFSGQCWPKGLDPFHCCCWLNAKRLHISCCRAPSVTGGVCGGVWDGDNRFSAGGVFATNQITGTYVAGQTIDVTVSVLPGVLLLPCASVRSVVLLIWGCSHGVIALAVCLIFGTF